LSATITSYDPRDQSPWDVDGSPPDVVVTMGCPLSDGGTEWVETEEVQAYTPMWTVGGCHSSQADLVARGVYVDVWDRDVFVDDTIDSFMLILTSGAFPSEPAVNTAERDGGLLTIAFSIANPQ
jgi:hypothetical protein